jgi:hypothetical protein
MTVPRMIAIALIFVVAAAAWMVLGGSVVLRTDSADSRLSGQVAGLWGERQAQSVPTFAARVGGTPLELAGSDITARFKLDDRRKGLLWYATYVVDFAATYKVSNPGTTTEAVMTFTFPSPNGVYNGYAVKVDGRDVPVIYEKGKATSRFTVPAGKTVSVATGYRTNGMDEWRYLPSPEGAGVIRDFTLAMKTDFAAVDYPTDAVSPTEQDRTDGGWDLTWRYDSVVSGRPIALTMPKPTDAGPLVSRVSFFAPVSLLFFFAALVLLTGIQGVKLHPMHYLFLALAFFAFHLLFAYLADRVDLLPSFLISAVVSLALAVGYLWLVIGRGRALMEIAISQFVFLVLFSYSFFFEGLTGLAVTIGSIITLAYFMAKTAHVDWEHVFERKPRQQPATPGPEPTAPGPGLIPPPAPQPAQPSDG